MINRPFRALILRRTAGKNHAAVEELTESDLPPGDVLVRVGYSGVNFKRGFVLSAE
jgi:acrylyl-CoA reductase (NADPH)